MSPRQTTHEVAIERQENVLGHVFNIRTGHAEGGYITRERAAARVKKVKYFKLDFGWWTSSLNGGMPQAGQVNG